MAEERSENPRRNFLRSTFVAISTTTLGSGVRPLLGDQKVSKAAQAAGVPQRFLTEPERSFLKAAVDRLVPGDEHGPGAVMSAIAQSLTAQDYADVAAYFASQPGIPKNSGTRMPNSNRGFHNSDPTKKLIFAGDPKRGIVACASCHGPGGYLTGAPALIHQNALYLEQQLETLAAGTRANDTNMPMRTNAGPLVPEEMKSLAAAYSKGFDRPE